MACVNADRVKETSTSTGTGTYALEGAVTGFRTFVSGVGTTNYCSYLAIEGTSWELGMGTVTDATPDTLARTAVLRSTNADAAVNWGAGTRTIACVPLGNDGSITFHKRVSLSGSAVTLGPIVFPMPVTRIRGNAFVVAPGALVPRLRLGGASIDTGSNYAATTALSNANNVGLVSTTALQLIVAAMANTNETSIDFNITKPTTSRVARATWVGSNISIVASSASVPNVGNGIWVNTADLIQRVELCGFTAITGTSTASMAAGTELSLEGTFIV